VPLGTPPLAGPGAIAAVMVFMHEASTASERVGAALGLVGVLVVLWLTLRFVGLVWRLLGQAGIELVTRISGLLLTAIAVKPRPTRSANSLGRRLMVLRRRTSPLGCS